MRTVAIIPARGGSKGIPRKNLVNFCGRPLVSWTIAAALAVPEIDAVFVSTDCQEISECAQASGAGVIRRPAELSGDAASSESAVIHACQVLEREHGLRPERVLMLQPTSPLREACEVSHALQQFDREELDSLFSAAVGKDQLWWTEEKGELRSLNYDYRHRQRRQCPEGSTALILETGSFYITRTRILIETGNRLAGRIGYFLVPFWKSFEIDEPEDLSLCASLMRHYQLDQRLAV